MDHKHDIGYKLYAVQMLLSELEENEMLGAITTFLSWEIVRRTMNIDNTLDIVNAVVQNSVRRLLGIKKWEDEE